MELVKGVTVDYVEGAIVLKAEVKSLVLAEIAKVEAKIESGEIDLVKGTDLDKQAALGLISALKGVL